MTSVNSVGYTKQGVEYAKNDNKYAKRGAKVGVAYIGASAVAAGGVMTYQLGGFSALKGAAKKSIKALKTGGIKDFATKAYSKLKGIKVSPETLKTAGIVGAAFAASALVYAGIGALIGHIGDRLVDQGAKKEAERRAAMEA